jgi:hypothetical protein
VKDAGPDLFTKGEQGIERDCDIPVHGPGLSRFPGFIGL